MRYNVIKSNSGDDNIMTNHERFTVIHKSWTQSSRGEHTILKDNDTGVLYYLVDTTMSGGGPALTPLLNADGKPIVDK